MSYRLFFFQSDNPKAEVCLRAAWDCTTNYLTVWTIFGIQAHQGLPGSYFSTHSRIDFQFRTSQFRHNMKWAQEALYVTITNSLVLKTFYQQTHRVHKSKSGS